MSVARSEGAEGRGEHRERCWGWRREAFPSTATVLLGLPENPKRINWATDVG